MGERKNRARRGLPPDAIVSIAGAKRAGATGIFEARRGEFPLPSGKRLVLIVPKDMSDEDKHAAAVAMSKVVGEWLPPTRACRMSFVFDKTIFACTLPLDHAGRHEQHGPPDGPARLTLMGWSDG